MKTLLGITFDDSEMVSESFKTVIEDHLNVLKMPQNIMEVKNVSPVDANRFEYDFYGLLRVLNVPVQYQWIVMRVNDLMSPSDYRRHMQHVKIPNTEIISGLLEYHNQVIKRSAGW